jgi:hypothetical protein
VAARGAAQQPKVPMVGFLHPGSAEPNVSLLEAFRKGLADAARMLGIELPTSLLIRANEVIE